jgi:hypothetical protein
MCWLYFVRQASTRGRRNCHGGKLMPMWGRRWLGTAESGLHLVATCLAVIAGQLQAQVAPPCPQPEGPFHLPLTGLAKLLAAFAHASTCTHPILCTFSPYLLQKYTLQNPCIRTPYFSNPSAASIVLYIRIGHTHVRTSKAPGAGGVCASPV